MTKRIIITTALLSALLFVSGCASHTEIEAPSAEATSSAREPEVDARAQYYIDWVNKRWGTCWPLIGDDEPSLQFREDKMSAREGYVDAVFIAETLTFSVGKLGDGSVATFPDKHTDWRVDKAGCYDIP